MYRGDFALGKTFDFKFTTVDTYGVPATLSSSPVVSIYADNNTTEITAGITLSADFDSRTGLNNVRVVATSGNGYATATNYQAVITTGTVASLSVVGYVVAEFSIENRSALRPTTADRTLDVSAGGEAGLDWANIGSPTTAQNLSATNIDVDQVVASVSGAVGSVTGNIGGNVTGSVGSVAAGGITAASIATDAIDADALAADAVAEIADGVWDEDATGHQTQGTFGQAIGDPVADTGTIFKATVTDATGVTVGTDTATLLSRLGTPSDLGSGATVAANLVDIEGQTDDIGVAGAGLTAIAAVGAVTGAVGSVTGNVGGNVTGSVGSVAAGGITAASIATGAVDADALAADAVAEIADGVWDEAIAGHLGAGSTGAALNAAGSAGDPWTTPLPGAYGAGTAGFIVGTNLDDTVTSRLAPTTAGRKLDVSVGGEAGLDWANIGSPTTAQNLSATNIDVDQVVASVSGAVGSVTGAVGSVTGNVGGNVVGSVASVTGNVGGNVVGSVGSVAAGGIAAASFAAGAIDATAIATDAITAGKIAADAITSSELATTAVNEIRDAILSDSTPFAGANIDATISSRATPAQVNAEVVDALNVDTYAEPGQGTPAATTTIRLMLGYLFKAWRNRTTQTATDYKLYNDDAVTVDQKATFSDDTTTADRSEIVTGP